MKLHFPVISAFALLVGLGGCKSTPPAPTATVPNLGHPKEVPTLMGGPVNGRIRLQVEVSPNPPYLGLNAFDVWVADPIEMLKGIPGAKVTLTMIPPTNYRLKPVKVTVTTGKDGKATAQLALSASGDWTLSAVAVSAKYGTAKLVHTVPVRLLQGQKDVAPIYPAGPVRLPTRHGAPRTAKPAPSH